MEYIVQAMQEYVDFVVNAPYPRAVQGKVRVQEHTAAYLGTNDSERDNDSPKTKSFACDTKRCLRRTSKYEVTEGSPGVTVMDDVQGRLDGKSQLLPSRGCGFHYVNFQTSSAPASASSMVQQWLAPDAQKLYFKAANSVRPTLSKVESVDRSP